jgi:hypothetical protein
MIFISDIRQYFCSRTSFSIASLILVIIVHMLFSTC